MSALSQRLMILTEWISKLIKLEFAQSRTLLEEFWSCARHYHLQLSLMKIRILSKRQTCWLEYWDQLLGRGRLLRLMLFHLRSNMIEFLRQKLHLMLLLWLSKGGSQLCPKSNGDSFLAKSSASKDLMPMLVEKAKSSHFRRLQNSPWWKGHCLEWQLCLSLFVHRSNPRQLWLVGQRLLFAHLLLPWDWTRRLTLQHWCCQCWISDLHL